MNEWKWLSFHRQQSSSVKQEPNTENFGMPSVGGQMLQYHSIIVVSSLSIVSFVTWCGENDSSANFEI